MIVAMRFNTVGSPASLLLSEAHSAKVFQRDAAIAAASVLSQDTRAGLSGQGWKETLAEVAEKVFFFPFSLSLSLLLFINSPGSLSAPGLAVQALSLTDNPGQDPYLSRAQLQRSPARCVW